LKVYGYLRGKNLSANCLVYLCNYGTYQISDISLEEGEMATLLEQSNEKQVNPILK
jgi:hypothetical protein